MDGRSQALRGFQKVSRPFTLKEWTDTTGPLSSTSCSQVILFSDVVLTLLCRATGSVLAIDTLNEPWLGGFLPTRFSHRREPIIMPTDRREHPSTTQTRSTSGIPTLLRRIECEYREMPGLRLTQAQAQRLWDLDTTTSRAVLAILTERGFLKRTPADTYIRARA